MFKRILVLALLIISSTAESSATHIVAGFSSYKHISGSNYEIKFTLIRDQLSGAALLDEEIIVQVFRFNGSIYTHEANVRIDLAGTYEFDHGELSDLAKENQISYEYGEYLMNYNLFETDEDYVFVYQRCCRSPIFTNLLNPGESGISLVTTITNEAKMLQNSSIEFDILPSILRAPNAIYEMPIEVRSLDGDTLSFQFSPSFLGGGTDGITSGFAESCSGLSPQGPCYPPYQPVGFNSSELNFFKPFPGWEDVAMDGQTGALSGAPSTIGQFAYGFTIHENRNGQIINSTSFDYFTVVALLTSSTESVVPSKLKVFGNPSSEKFMIDLGQKDQYQFELYNMSGNKTEFNSSGNSGVVDLEILGPAGIYSLRAFNGKNIESIKLIKL